MFYFDPLYLVFTIPPLLLSMWASFKTKSAFKKYSRVRINSGMTGAQAAQLMLQRSGITDVEIVPHKGFMTDHYNPMNKTLALSEPVYGQPTVAAVGVACHEVGHAIQHATHYGPLRLRSLLVKPANIGSNLGIWVIMAGMFFGGMGMVKLGVVMFAAAVAFTVITLPVEFDASARAKKLAPEYGIVFGNEIEGVNKVLNAAAMTYVAAAASSIATLLYFLLRSGILGGSRD